MAKSEIKMTMSLATQGATRALSSMGAKIRTFSEKGSAALNRVAQVGVAGIIAGFGAAARSSLSLGREIENLSRVANSTPAEFQKWAYAAQTVGIEQEKLADMFKDFDERVGQFINDGSGELKQFFTEIAPKVGVTAEEFAKLSGPEAIGLYVKSLQQVGIEGKSFDEYLERTASDMKVLSPLFADQSKVLKQLSKDAVTNGQVMSDATSKALNKMSLSFDRFKKKAVIKVGQIIGGEGDHAAIKQLGAQFMAMMAKVGVWLGNAFLGAVKTLAAGMIASVQTLVPRLTSGFKSLGLVLKRAIAPVVNDLVDTLNNIPGIELPKMDVSEIEQQLIDLSNAPKKGFSESFNQALEGMNHLSFSAENAVGFWEDMAGQQGKILTGAQGTAEATTTTAGNVSIIADKYRTIKELELDLQKAMADGDKMEQGALQDQIELEKLVADLRKQGITDRKEALAIAEKILFNQKEMERAEEALMDAHIEGNDALIHEEQKRLDMLKSIDDVMKSTGKNYDDAVIAAEKLAAIRFGPDLNQSGFATNREQREFDRQQKIRQRAIDKRIAAEKREEALLGGGLLGKRIPRDKAPEARAADRKEDRVRRADIREAQKRMRAGEDAGKLMQEMNERRAARQEEAVKDVAKKPMTNLERQAAKNKALQDKRDAEEKAKNQPNGPDGKPVGPGGNHVGPDGKMVGPNGEPLGPNGKPVPAGPKKPGGGKDPSLDKLDKIITELGSINKSLQC